MPQHLRAYCVLLVLAALTFLYLNVVARNTIGTERFRYMRNSWFLITSIAFLAHNYWIYIAISFVYLYFTSQRETNKVALFYMLLFAVPLAGVDIPGFGIVNYIFTLNHQRFLVIVLLLPFFIKLITSNKAPERLNNLDIILIIYIILTIFLHYRGTTITDTLRFAFTQCIDIYIPFYVVSRSLKTFDQLNTVIFCYIGAAMLLSMIGIFEMLKHWHLFSALERELGMSRAFSYLDRAGLLRAHATIERISLGYVIAISLGLYLYFQNRITSQTMKLSGYALLTLGLISPLSRGPWVGAFGMVLIFIAMGQQRIRTLSLLAISVGLISLLASLTPSGSKFLDLIPFLGETEAGNISYRERLIETSQIVIARNPWFGSVNYLETPEMESMRQGQGIIDIVNTYIQIALEYGYVGLALFLSFLFVTCWKVNRYRKLSSALGGQESLIGRALLSSMICIMIIIFTVSSVAGIAIMYWTIPAMCAAYVSITKKELRNANAEQTSLNIKGTNNIAHRKNLSPNIKA